MTKSFVVDPETGKMLSAQEWKDKMGDKVSGKGTWDSNPWVFVYEFEKLK